MAIHPKPPTLALVCASIHTGASRGLWTGLVDEALARGARVICLPGGRLGATGAWESSRNSNYRLAGRRNADGIVSWTTSLSGSADPGAVEAFVASLSGLPLVTVSQAAAGAPLVAFDAYRGMRAMVEHLIEVHGHERIAFIRGPASHVSAEQRYRAYRDALAERGLAFRPELVTEALPWDAGGEAARLLLDEARLRPGRDFTALVAASDLLAFWAMEGFLSRGWSIPEDLAIAGFNDSLESTLASPALSTVRIDFEKEGATAADILLRLLAGERLPGETILPARLRLRRSCGCPTILPEGPGEGPATGGIPAAGPGRRALLGSMAALLGADPRLSGPWLEALLDGLAMEQAREEAVLEDSPFLAAFELALDRTSPEGLEPGGWQPLLSLLRGLSMPRREGPEPRSVPPRLENLFHRARSLAFEASRRAITRAQWLEEQKALELRRAGAALLLCHDTASLAATLGEALPRLGIPRAWLALGGAGLPSLNLVAALGEGCPALPAGGLGFEADLVLPRGFLPESGAFVVEPLFFREECLGRLVLEIGPRDGGVYEELRSYLSSALKSASLFGQAEEARRRAEAADLVKTRLMASVSRGLFEPLGWIAREAAALGQTGIRREAEAQLALIGDLLDLSRADIGDLVLELGLVDPLALVREVQGEGPEGVGVGTPDRLPLVIADRGRLLNILRGLRRGFPGGGEGMGRLEARLEANLVVIEGRGRMGARDQGLARRVIGLIGGSLGFFSDSGVEGFRLCLPLPSALGDLPPGPRPGRVHDLSHGLPAEGEAGGIGLLAADLGAGGGGEWPRLGALRQRPDLASLPLAVYPPPGPLPPEPPPRQAAAFLDRLEAAWPRASSPAILVLASSAPSLEELSGLARACLPGRRLARALVPDLPGGLEAPGPAFVLADPAGAEAWLARARGPFGGPSLPVLVLLPELCPPGPGLLGRPELLLVHRGVLPPACLSSLFAGLGEGRLPLGPGARLLVQGAQVWLAERHAQAISRSDLAASLGVGGDYLGRLFHGLLGLPPWEYLGRYRVRVAQTLLEGGRIPLAEVGARVGLPDQAYFSRVFRKFTGAGPRDWGRPSA